MQKINFAVAAGLATAGLLSAPAMADTSVMVYGIADAYVGYGKTGDKKFTGVNNAGLSGSRLGFRGTEDLGNGLKAVFTLEYALAIDTNEGVGTSGARSRQQFIGLEGAFGFIGLGRQYSPGYFISTYDAAIAAPALSPQALLSNAARSNIIASTPARISNSINYKSPTFAGLSLNAIYGFNEVNQEDNRRAGDVAAMGLKYASGPIGINLIYSQVKQEAGAIGSEKFEPTRTGATPIVTDPVTGLPVFGPPALTVADETKKEWFLGAVYDFKMLKLMGSYQEVKDATNTSGKEKVWQIGTVVPVGAAGNFRVAYGKLDAEIDDSDADAWTLLYTHALSKRTTAYAGYGQIGNDDGRAISPLAQGVNGDTSRNFLVGMRHAF